MQTIVKLFGGMQTPAQPEIKKKGGTKFCYDKSRAKSTDREAMISLHDFVTK